MEERDLITYLTRNIYRSDPRPEWFRETRKKLTGRMEGQPNSPGYWFISLKNAIAQLTRHSVLAGSMLAVVLALLGGITFAASRNVLPSSTLYPLKLAAESAAGSLAFSAQSQADYTLSRAEHRFQELSELSQVRITRTKDSLQPDLIAKTARRYAAALTDSTKTLKRLKAEGNTALAKRTAEKLERTAQAYTTLLSLLDTASVSSTPRSVFQDTKEVSDEAQRTAQEILYSDQTLGQLAPEASASIELEPITSSSSSLPQPDTTPTVIPSVMPNIVEPS